MPALHLFEYAVIRFVPKVEREEFINIGVILYCKRPPYLSSKLNPEMDKLLHFAPDLDIEALRNYLCSYEKICTGGDAAGPIGRMDHASRFRWLTATRSTIVQSSKVHAGFSADLDLTLAELYRKLVL